MGNLIDARERFANKLKEALPEPRRPDAQDSAPKRKTNREVGILRISSLLLLEDAILEEQKKG